MTFSIQVAKEVSVSALEDGGLYTLRISTGAVNGSLSSTQESCLGIFTVCRDINSF